MPTFFFCHDIFFLNLRYFLLTSKLCKTFLLLTPHFPMFIHLLEIYIIHESLKIHLTIRETLTDDFGNQSRNESLAVADAHLESIKNEMLWKSSYPKSVRRVSPGTTIGFTKGKCWDIYLLLISVRVSLFITPILKSLVVPVI